MNTLVAIQRTYRARLFQLALVAMLCAVYIWLFLTLYPVVKGGVAPIGIVPVLLAGWLLGRWGGLITGLCLNVVTVWLFWVVGAEFALAILLFQALPANLIVPAAGYLIGQLRALLRQTRSQAAALAYEHARLQSEIAAHHRTEAELREAKEIAEAANNAKSKFLSNMSHELRTPLTTIIGYSDLLRIQAEETGSADCVADIDKILNASHHLVRLINSVLDLSKIEAGKLPLEIMEFSLPDMISEVVSAIRPAMAKQLNTLTVEIDSTIATIAADPTKVRQSLFNLLGNAAKFTTNGQVRLLAGTRQHNGHAWVTLAVQDTGIGIAAEHLPQLFSEFTQARSVTKSYGGTGLGLAISQRLCTLMGGNITVESTLGQGSTFTIWLPAARRNHDSAAYALGAQPC